MKSNGNIGGLILIFLGFFWLMSNFGIINWSFFDVLFKLWPVILIVIGINILFKTKEYVRYITWTIFFIILVVFGFYNQYAFKNDVGFNINPNFAFENRLQTNSGKLNLKLGGGNIRIDSIEDKLIKAKLPELKVKKDVNFSSDDTKVDIDIEQKTSSIDFNQKKSYSYDFNLNENILWNLNIDTGAINGTFDFSNLKVSKIDIDMGVSNLNLIFGDKQDYTKVDIDGGISNLELTIPENFGVKVDFDGAIKSTNISGLRWEKSGDYYISPNYDEAEKKIDIDVNTAIGKFDVIMK